MLYTTKYRLTIDGKRKCTHGWNPQPEVYWYMSSKSNQMARENNDEIFNQRYVDKCQQISCIFYNETSLLWKKKIKKNKKNKNQHNLRVLWNYFHLFEILVSNHVYCHYYCIWVWNMLISKFLECWNQQFSSLFQYQLLLRWLIC